MTKAKRTKTISTAIILGIILAAQAIGSIYTVYAAEEQEPAAPGGVSAVGENVQSGNTLSSNATVKETYVTSEGDLLIIMSDGTVKNAGKVVADSTTVSNAEGSTSKSENEKNQDNSANEAGKESKTEVKKMRTTLIWVFAGLFIIWIVIMILKCTYIIY